MILNDLVDAGKSETSCILDFEVAEGKAGGSDSSHSLRYEPMTALRTMQTYATAANASAEIARAQHRNLGCAAISPRPAVRSGRNWSNPNRPFAAVGLNNGDADNAVINTEWLGVLSPP